MIRSFVLVLLLLPVCGFSQALIGKSKSSVKKHLQEYTAKNDSLAVSMTETDSTILYSIKPGKSLAADFIYSFDKSGNCISQYVKASCDSCYKKYLQNALNEEKYGWKKINENQYISKYKYQLLIELPGDESNFSFVILRTGWTKKSYDLLLN